MCPFGQTNEAKFKQAIEAGKISTSGYTNDFEVKAGLVKAHYI